MSRREFPTKVRVAAFKRANGACERCDAKLTVGKFHYDHVIADAMGGEPTLSNCEVLCWVCHSEKTRERDVPNIAKAKRREARHIGAKAKSQRPMPGGKNSEWKRTFSQGWVKRES